MRTIIRDGITLTVPDDATDAYIEACFQGAAGLAAMQAASKAPYGDVSYADPGYQDDKKKRYPLDSEQHVRAAWSYINKPANRTPYNADQLSSIEDKIKAAGKKYDIKFASASEAEVEVIELEGVTLVLPDGTRARFAAVADAHVAAIDNPTVADMVMPGDEDQDDDDAQLEQLQSDVDMLKGAVEAIIQMLTADSSDDSSSAQAAAGEPVPVAV